LQPTRSFLDSTRALQFRAALRLKTLVPRVLSSVTLLGVTLKYKTPDP